MSDLLRQSSYEDATSAAMSTGVCVIRTAMPSPTQVALSSRVPDAFG